MKTMSLKDFNGFQKAILSEEQVKILEKESGLKLAEKINFFCYLSFLFIACLSTWGFFQDGFPIIYVPLLIFSFVGIYICSRESSVAKKQIKNLKIEFCYVECEVLHLYLSNGYAEVRTTDGVCFTETVKGTEECQKGDKVLLYKVEGFKDKDRGYYLTTLKL